jgi:hypothetical protein
MEISRVKIKGSDVNVVYNGTYYFIDTFYGILAIAERTDEDREKGTIDIKIRIGNTRTLGGRMQTYSILPSIKKFLTKSENRFIEKKVNYNVVDEDLNKTYLTIEEHKCN